MNSSFTGKYLTLFILMFIERNGMRAVIKSQNKDEIKPNQN